MKNHEPMPLVEKDTFEPDIKCSVPGCEEEVTGNVGKNDEFHLCKAHGEAWGYYRKGFYRGRGFRCDGLLRRKVWYEAMREFLEDCHSEVLALQQLGIPKDASLEEAYGAAIGKTQRSKGER